MFKSSSTTPNTKSPSSWVAAIANVGMVLPTMISTDVAALARRRSHVFQPCSLKKAKPAYEAENAANITAIPGTACSAPLAPANPSAARDNRNSGFMNAIISSGIPRMKTIVEGSSRSTRKSCRAMAALRRGDI